MFSQEMIRCHYQNEEGKQSNNQAVTLENTETAQQELFFAKQEPGSQAYFAVGFAIQELGIMLFFWSSYELDDRQTFLLFWICR